MKKKNLFRLIPLLLLAAGLSIAGCSNPSNEPPPPTPPNTTELSATISAAETLRDATFESTDGEDITIADKWVTSGEKGLLETAITTAKGFLGSGSQTDINNATEVLKTAIDVFTSAQKDGKKDEGLSLDQLGVLHGKAETLKAELSKNDNAPDDISPNEHYMTTTDYNALETAVTAAKDAVDRVETDSDMIDSLFKTLDAAMKKASYGTSTDISKGLLDAAISDAETQTKNILNVQDETYAPEGSEWADAGQWSPFTDALDDAKTVSANDNATQNMVLTTTTDLDDALTAFLEAVDNNPDATGTSLDKAAVTINGLSAYNGIKMWTVLINNDLAELNGDETDDYDVVASGGGGGNDSSEEIPVSNGAVSFDLTTSGQPWTASGQYYVVLGWDFGVWVTKSRVNFGTSGTQNLSIPGDFQKMGMKFILGQMPNTEGFTGSMRLDDMLAWAAANAPDSPDFDDYTSWKVFMTAMMNANSGMPNNYKPLIDFGMYKDINLTQEYKGTDYVNPETVLYMAFDIMEFMSGGDDGPPPRDPIGTLTGSIDFTGVPTGEEFEVYIHPNTNGWNGSVKNGPEDGNVHNGLLVTGDGTRNWTMPIYGETFTSDDTVSFNVTVYPRALGTSRDGMYFSLGPVPVTDANQGGINLGSVDCAYIVLEGTVNASWNGGPVPRLHISAINQTYTGSTATHLNTPPTSGAPWKLAFPKSALSAGDNSIWFSVRGRPENDYEQDLFRWDIPSPDPVIVPGNSSGQTGIVLDAGAFPKS